MQINRQIYNFYKNTAAYRAFAAAADSKTAGHAYIISSADSFSAENVARLIACRLLCRKPLAPCLSCEDCSRVLKGIHPDCEVFPQKGSKLYVADADKLVESSFYTPAEGGNKVFLLYHGQTLTPQAQNKLLKTLEEPPAGTYIVLCSTQADSILPTLSSRSFTLEIKPFSTEDTALFLQLYGADSSRADLIALSGGGDLGKAVAMLEDDGFLEISGLIYSLWENCLKTQNIPVLAAKLAAYPDKTQTAKTLQIYFRDMLMVKTGLPQTVINKAYIQKLETAANRFESKTLIELIDQTNQIKEAALLNVNFQTLLEALLRDVVQCQVGE